MTVEERLEELRGLILLLVERQTVKDFYEIEEFARLVDDDYWPGQGAGPE